MWCCWPLFWQRNWQGTLKEYLSFAFASWYTQWPHVLKNSEHIYQVYTGLTKRGRGEILVLSLTCCLAHCMYISGYGVEEAAQWQAWLLAITEEEEWVLQGLMIHIPPHKHSIAEVQFWTVSSDQTGRTEQTVRLQFQFQFGLRLSVLVRSSGMRKFLGTAFEPVQTELNGYVIFIFLLRIDQEILKMSCVCEDWVCFQSFKMLLANAGQANLAYTMAK